MSVSRDVASIVFWNAVLLTCLKQLKTVSSVSHDPSAEQPWHKVTLEGIVSVQHHGCAVEKRHHPCSNKVAIKFPVQIKLLKWNCFISNSVNLGHSLGHYDNDFECLSSQLHLQLPSQSLFNHVGSMLI